MDAERVPVAKGVKLTLMMQLVLTAIADVVQVLVAEKSCGFAPPSATFEI